MAKKTFKVGKETIKADVSKKGKETIVTYQIGETDDIPEPISKDMLRHIKSKLGDYTLVTNSGVELHSSEVKKNTWNGITIKKKAFYENRKMDEGKASMIKPNSKFSIHNEVGWLMDTVKGYDDALRKIRVREDISQLIYKDPSSDEFVMVYAHIPKGETLKKNVMWAIMKLQKIKPNKIYFLPEIKKWELHESKKIVGETKMNILEVKYKGYDIKKQNRKDAHPYYVPSLQITGASMKDIKQQIDKKLGENTMKIKRSELVEMIKSVIKEETEYQKFFKATLDKFGVKSPASLDDAKKKEFFDYIEKNWTKETNETLEPVSAAAGNPLKRVKAKKRDQILAKEEKIRQIVREELKFVMFNEVPGTTSRKVAKKRIAQSGNTTSSL